MTSHSEKEEQTLEIDWTAACKSERCPICTVGEYQEFIFYIHYQARLYSEPLEREKVTQNLGFCNYHAWQFYRIAGPDGIVGINYELIMKSLEVMEKYALASEQPLNFSPLCLICNQFRRIEELIQQGFISFLATESGMNYFGKSNGLCIPHLQNILQHRLTQTIRSALVKNETQVMQKLKIDLTEYRKKRREKNRAAISKDEMDSWRRSTEQIVGRRGLKWLV
jgi:hypothetical protein